MHEIVKIIGEENSKDDLCSFFKDFLQDASKKKKCFSYLNFKMFCVLFSQLKIIIIIKGELLSYFIFIIGDEIKFGALKNFAKFLSVLNSETALLFTPILIDFHVKL